MIHSRLLPCFRCGVVGKLCALRLCSGGNGSTEHDDNLVSSLSDKLAKPGGREKTRLIKGITSESGENPSPEKVGENAPDDKILGEQVLSAINSAAQVTGENKERTKKDLQAKLIQLNKETVTDDTIGDIFKTLSGMEYHKEAVSGVKKRRSRPKVFSRLTNERRGRDDDTGDIKELRERFGQPFRRPDIAAVSETKVDQFQREIGGLSSGGGRQISLFSGPGLGIFESKSKESPSCSTTSYPKITLPMWGYLEDRRLKLLSSQSPRNGFEEMIRWTEEGKMWPYPIDNEWGWTEEVGVGFHQHVFLTPLLDKLKLPKSGPVRVFMEMVCTGLSKNPYMTVDKKREHLLWFEEYFADKLEDIERLHQEEFVHRKKLSEE